MENSVLQGLLSESMCKKPVLIKTEPISDKYTVETRPFARGKFATVRRCKHKDSGIEYAAKYMRKRRRASDVRHEILHEAHVLELSIQHPHIVQLHEVYETPSEIILVLELVPGGELQRVLDDEEVVPEKEASRLLRQILSGVCFLHEHKIAHLDLKPQNLLLTKPFPNCEVKLCDFGISRLITKGIEIREIVGTPDYVAPEVLHYEPISLPTDMWSIGILTYVLLSGHSPFGGDTKQETFCNITRGTLEFPSDLFGTVSNNAKDFIRRLLVREPSERMSAKECLSHPWLYDGEAAGTPRAGISLTLLPSPEKKNAADYDSDSSVNSREDTYSPRSNFSRLSDTNKSNQSNGFRKSLSPKPNDSTPNEEKTPSRSVDMMVAQFEGLAMSKRIVFSEEIIVDERVGMVY
ncbi:serine/threonine-protein kinase 17A-like [Uloborus diversus]|uniref:serine/threonine-protein kinase 17A-like n=1 Tax=Uloborus diversus TaxID=327109 RepID=UPI002409B0A7|nr:serine/threonine-protein kinase 17A-like [Uloborus diversus]